MLPRFRPAARLALLAVPFLVGGYALAEAPREAAPTPRTQGDKAVPNAAAELDQKIIAEAKDHSQVMANLQHLSDVIGPRLTGSANLERANRWAEEKMKSYGLVNVRLEPWEIPVGWERGTATMRLIEPNNRPLLIAAAGWSPGTKGKVTGPVVVLNARTKEELEKYKGKLKNAIVLRTPPSNVAPITDLNYLGGPPAAKKDRKKDEAKKEEPKAGAATDEPKKEEPKKDAPPSANQPPRPNFAEMAAIRQEMDAILKSEGAAAVLSDSNKPHGLLVTTGGWRGGDRAAEQDPIARLFVAHEHYALLYRLASAKDAKPPVVELEVSNKFVPGPITVFNTIGEITGSEKPDEVVVVGAHLDSWDLASGTTDNGTGSCVVLETARVLSEMAKAGNRPKRTIRFCLFTGEEQGLWGSRKYVEKHKDEMAKHQLALVHDTGTGRVLGFATHGREKAKAILDPELESLKSLDGWRGLDLGSLGGSDHQSFHSSGVPGFACRQDNDEYRLTHHTQTDTFDKAKEPNLIQGVTVMAVTATRAANLPELLPRETPAGGGFGPKRGGRGDEPKKDAKKPEEKKPPQ